MHNQSGTNPRLHDADFRKSSRSGNGPDCVEVAFLADGDVAVRHSQAPNGHVLVYTPSEWDAFTPGRQIRRVRPRDG
ncbi:DUF397 domain-containing protein [Nocardia sp. NPDC004151]|uniref:DUF397 domain-containing protein n=1 Tax=Nocardia sp. NPDC004151 TaxID=3364304 RepID=UPI00368BFB94